MQLVLKIIFFLFVINLSNVYASSSQECKWDSKKNIPCITIKAPNSNPISKKISQMTIISKQQIEDNNLIDLVDVLNFINGPNVFQSGPRGQQASLFLRGTNSNHTLVLLNGIPINDQSTTNGAYDFGQDFMHNISRVEVHKGVSGAHFGADAIGGAVNFITNIDYKNKMSLITNSNSKNIQGNYVKNINDWEINIQGGLNESKTKSALYNGTDLDGTKNRSLGLNVNKWFSNNLRFRNNLIARNTLSDLDGHTLPLQSGYDSDNTMYALQSGLDYYKKDTKNYITLHTHSFDRNYDSPNNEFDEYDSKSYTARGEHSKSLSEKFSYGLGFEYKYDESTFSNRGSYNSSLTGHYDNIGFFTNLGYKVSDKFSTSINIRTDNNNITDNNKSYKIGMFKEDLITNLNVRLNHAAGYKNPSLYELFGADSYGYAGNINLSAEKSRSNELSFDYTLNPKSILTLSLYNNEIDNLIEYKNSTYINNNTNVLKQNAIELSYALKNNKNKLNFFANSLSSKKTNGSDQLRRPEWNFGVNYNRIFSKKFKLTTNYKFIGEHFDIHNSNYSNIVMPKVHLMNIGFVKNYFGYDIGINITNLFNEDYQAPHGFSQNGRNFNYILKKKF